MQFPNIRDSVLAVPIIRILALGDLSVYGLPLSENKTKTQPHTSMQALHLWVP